MLTVEFFINHDDHGNPQETEVQKFSDDQTAIQYAAEHAECYSGSSDFYLRADCRAPIVAIHNGEDEVLSVDIVNDRGVKCWRVEGHLSLKFEAAMPEGTFES